MVRQPSSSLGPHQDGLPVHPPQRLAKKKRPLRHLFFPFRPLPTSVHPIHYHRRCSPSQNQSQNQKHGLNQYPPLPKLSTNPASNPRPAPNKPVNAHGSPRPTLPLSTPATDRSLPFSSPPPPVHRLHNPTPPLRSSTNRPGSPPLFRGQPISALFPPYNPTYHPRLTSDIFSAPVPLPPDHPDPEPPPPRPESPPPFIPAPSNNVTELRLLVACTINIPLALRRVKHNYFIAGRLL